MPNNELDLRGLDEIFSDTNNIDREAEEKKVDFNTDIDYDDAIQTLRANIFNANQLLEKIQHEMNNGNFSARLAEVASTVINSVTATAKELLTDKDNEKAHALKLEILELKKKELDFKQAKMISHNQGSTTNVLIASREDILKSIEGKTLKQIPSNTNETE